MLLLCDMLDELALKEDIWRLKIDTRDVILFGIQPRKLNIQRHRGMSFIWCYVLRFGVVIK